MSDPFIAEVKIFAGNFAPRGWAFCDGTLLPIAQNTALFALVGTIYGGDGRTTLGLPNLMGRAAMHPGNGPGLTSRNLGQSGGTETVTLSGTQMPNHTHQLGGSDDAADEEGQKEPANALTAEMQNNQAIYAPPGTGTARLMASQAVADQGGGQFHNNMQPFLVMTFIIALTGLFPSRN